MLLTKIRNAQYYSIICDEVTDQARQHQLGIAIRWIDENFGVQEDFVELGLLPAGDAETITKMIKDCVVRHCQSTCVEGGAMMAPASCQEIYHV